MSNLIKKIKSNKVKIKSHRHKQTTTVGIHWTFDIQGIIQGIKICHTMLIKIYLCHVNE